MKNINFESSFIQAWYAKDFSKKAEKAAMNALILKNRNEALDAAMKIREASRFN